MKAQQRSKPEKVKVGNVSVKIYRRTRKTFTGGTREVFEIADYSVGRRRLRGFTDHRQARLEAERIASAIASGEAVAASLTGTEAASYGRAVELLRPTGASLEIATATYAKAFEILKGDRLIDACNFYAQHRADQITPRNVAAVVAELIELKTARGSSARYIGDLRARLARFADAFAVEIASVTTADVQGWLDKMKLAPRSVKNFRGALATLFSFAESRGFIFKGGNPVVGTEKISGNGDGEIEIFTPKEIAEMLAHAPKNFVPFLAVGAFAGLRAAEIERLEWRDVDFAGGFIHCAAEKTKTRSRRIVPIAANLAAWLTPHARKTGKVWTGNERDLLAVRAETCKAAGVDWKDNGLRHSFISYRLAEIQDAAKVSLEAGNSPQMIFQHYREVVKPAQAAQWFAIKPATEDTK